jgi:hypothetical protein
MFFGVTPPSTSIEYQPEAVIISRPSRSLQGGGDK